MYYGHGHMDILKLPVSAASYYSLYIAAVKRRVPRTEGPLSCEILHLCPWQSGWLRQKAPLSYRPLSLLSCHRLFGIRRNLRYADNLCSHWQISVFGPGQRTHTRTLWCARRSRARTYTHLGPAQLSSSACQRAAPVNGNKTPRLAALS